MNTLISGSEMEITTRRLSSKIDSRMEMVWRVKMKSLMI